MDTSGNRWLLASIPCPPSRMRKKIGYGPAGGQWQGPAVWMCEGCGEGLWRRGSAGMDTGLPAQPLLWVPVTSKCSAASKHCCGWSSSSEPPPQACGVGGLGIAPCLAGSGGPAQHGLPQAQRAGFYRGSFSAGSPTLGDRGVPLSPLNQVGLGLLKRVSAEPPKTTTKVAIVCLAEAGHS